MIKDKCFCHFNGFAVKDATARKQIEQLENETKTVVATAQMAADTAALSAEMAKQYATSISGIIPVTIEQGGLNMVDGYKEYETNKAARTGFFPVLGGAIGCILPDHLNGTLVFYDEDHANPTAYVIPSGKTEIINLDAHFARLAFTDNRGAGANIPTVDPAEVSEQVTVYVPKKTFHANLKETDGTKTIDKTFSELYAAHEAGITISLRIAQSGEVLPLMIASPEELVFQNINKAAYTRVIIKDDDTNSYETGECEATDEQIAYAVEKYMTENPNAGGQPGADVVSPVATVEQTAEGAVIKITDKNGETTATVTNGKDGYTPVRGVDYFTEADKAEIVKTVIESLGGNPVFGIVDDNNNITVYGDLAAGAYSVKYEKEDGSTVDIGQLVLDTDEPDEPDEPVPTYTNLANPSDANWKEGIRLNSSYSEVAAEGMVTTNLIAAAKGDVIRVKGLTFGNSSNERVCQYLNGTANNALVSTVNTDLYSVSGDITTITLDGSAVTANGTHVRICGTLTGTSSDVVITVNEEIA